MQTRKQAIGRRVSTYARRLLSLTGPIALTVSVVMICNWPKTGGVPVKDVPPAAPVIDPLSLVFTAQTGESRTDKEISRLQQEIRDGKNLERLDRTGVGKGDEHPH